MRYTPQGPPRGAGERCSRNLPEDAAVTAGVTGQGWRDEGPTASNMRSYHPPILEFCAAGGGNEASATGVRLSTG